MKEFILWLSNFYIQSRFAYYCRFLYLLFIRSPDFDKNDEPIAGDSILVSRDGSFKFTKQKKDPQIYHHKWLFVKDDYTGLV